jgi:hypothetical protein
MEKTRQYMVRTTIQDQHSVQVFFKRIKYRYMIFTVFSFLVVFLSAGLIFAESDDALSIDESGNVTVGKKLKAKKFEGDGSAITVGGVELVKQVEGNPPLTLEEVVRAVVADMVPIGTIMAYGGDVKNEEIKKKLEDQGWLACDGRLFDVKKYPQLYSAIGKAFGFEKEQFRVPDMQGRFLRGVDHGTGRDPDAAGRKPSYSGGNGGKLIGSVQDDQFKSHNHPLKKVPTLIVDRKAGRYGGGIWGDFGKFPRKTEDKGGNETRPKNIYVNWIIKAKNIVRTQQ